MLQWSLTFLAVAVVAAVFGFGGIATGATQIAQVLFVVFLVIFSVTLMYSLLTGRKPPASIT